MLCCIFCEALLAINSPILVAHVFTELLLHMDFSSLIRINCNDLLKTTYLFQLPNHSISRFQLVFYLNADEFHDDVCDSIFASLLPDDSGISKDELATLLSDPLIQEAILFIVDGCDENVHQKPQLQKLIMGKLYQNASVLVTARPALCNVFLKYFDIACVVLGFTQSQMLEFVSKYAMEMKCSPKFVENLKGAVSDGHDLQDISRNPLQLWFLCLLCEEHLEELPDTRTELYEMVTNLLVNRGVLKYNLDLIQVLEHVKVIYKLSCLAIQKGETFSISDPSIVKKHQVDILLKLGLLVKECGPSRLYPDGRYSFPHKTFQEFFAAKYLQDLSFQEQNAYLRHNRDKRWDMVIVFLCGLSSQNESQSTVRLFKNILQKDLQSAVKAVDSKSVSAELQHHSRHHLGLQCLAECPHVQGLEDIEDSIIPPTYIHNTMTCTYCLRGFVLSTNFHQRSHDFVINCVDSMAFIGKDSALKQAFSKMKQCTSLVLTNVSSRMVVTEFLTLFLSCALELSHLYVYLSVWMISESVQESRRESLPMAKLLPKLKSLVFQGSLGTNLENTPCTETTASVTILDYLLSNIGSDLRTLVIKDVEITDVLLRRLCIVVNDCSVEYLTLENVTVKETHGQILFTRIADACCVKKMHITSLEVSSGENKLCHLSGVLQTICACPLQELLYRSQGVSQTFIDGVFSYCVSKSLSSLDLSYVSLDGKMWDTITSHLGYFVSLRELALVSCGLNNANLVKFSHVCLDLLELTSLDLSNNRIGADQHFHLFCDTVRRHSKLKLLNIEGCGITDKKMDAVLNLIESSGFRTLYLVGNPLGSEDQLASFLSSQLHCSPSLQTLHFTCCILTTDFLANIAKNLRHSNIENLGISCLPCSGVIGPENFFTIHKMFRAQMPRLQTFGFGVSLDIDSAREPEPENHAKWRALCL